MPLGIYPRISKQEREARDREICRCYRDNGESYSAIGRRFKTSHQTVRAALQRAGLWKHYWKSREDKDRQIIDLYQRGGGIKTLSRKFELSTMTIVRILKKAKVWRKGIWKKRAQERKIRNRKICVLYLKGNTVASLARQFNLSPAVIVGKILKRSGLWHRTRKVSVWDGKKEQVADRNREISRLYAKGEGISSLAKEFQLTEAPVIGILKQKSIWKTGVWAEREKIRNIKKEKARRMYTEGKSVLSIVRETGFSYKGITHMLKRAGLYRKKIFVKYLSKEQLKFRNREICRLYKQGVSMHRLAYKFDRDDKTIKAVLKKAGIYRQRIFHLTRKEQEIRRAQIFELHRAGVGLSAIARAVSTYKSSVYGILRRAGFYGNFVRDFR